MSFVCDKCSSPQKDGQKPYRKIVEKRSKIYSPIEKVDGSLRAPIGWEIVREDFLCKSCYQE